MRFMYESSEFNIRIGQTERLKAKTKYSPVSCPLGKKIRVGRSEKDFIFYFIFILFFVNTLTNNDLSL